MWWCSRDRLAKELEIIENIKRRSEERKKKREEKQKKREEELLKKSTDDMLSKMCPINQGPCSKDCIHFREGWVYSWDFEDYTYHDHKKSICKLWR